MWAFKLIFINFIYHYSYLVQSFIHICMWHLYIIEYMASGKGNNALYSRMSGSSNWIDWLSSRYGFDKLTQQWKELLSLVSLSNTLWTAHLWPWVCFQSFILNSNHEAYVQWDTTSVFPGDFKEHLIKLRYSTTEL